MKRYARNEHRNTRRQPFVRALVALHDTDTRAVLIDITPINLADTCCPLCGGRSTTPGQEPEHHGKE